MTEETMIQQMREAVDAELLQILQELTADYPAQYTLMLKYQLGLEGEHTNSAASGKRIRPLLVLLSNHAAGGDWQKALPAAAAVELLHNFSLIHDDLQDDSELRRGRPTVWVNWGRAQAINAGDAMLAAAFLSVLRLKKYFDETLVVSASQMLQNACLQLTRGQHLDIAFEQETEISLELYWKMIEGKTGALLAACLSLGALTACLPKKKVDQFMTFGLKIGAAFQVQDDWLGIWGDTLAIGKSNTSDLISKKKSYPTLLGIQNKGEFYREWQSLTLVKEEDAKKLAKLLVDEGIETETHSQYESLYQDAMTQFETLSLDGNRSVELSKLVTGLFGRIK